MQQQRQTRHSVRQWGLVSILTILLIAIIGFSIFGEGHVEISPSQFQDALEEGLPYEVQGLVNSQSYSVILEEASILYDSVSNVYVNVGGEGKTQEEGSIEFSLSGLVEAQFRGDSFYFPSKRLSYASFEFSESSQGIMEEVRKFGQDARNAFSGFIGGGSEEVSSEVEALEEVEAQRLLALQEEMRKLPRKAVSQLLNRWPIASIDDKGWLITLNISGTSFKGDDLVITYYYIHISGYLIPVMVIMMIFILFLMMAPVWIRNTPSGIGGVAEGIGNALGMFDIDIDL